MRKPATMCPCVEGAEVWVLGWTEHILKEDLISRPSVEKPSVVSATHWLLVLGKSLSLLGPQFLFLQNKRFRLGDFKGPSSYNIT